MLAAIGFRHVEPFGGLFGDPIALKAALTENGLDAPTAHVGLPSLREDFDGTMRKLAEVGVKVCIVPAPPPAERSQDVAGWKTLGAELLGYAMRAKEAGFGFGWHNHDFEFAPLADGSYPLEWILGEDPAVQWQCDIAWVMRGHQDPAAWIKRYAGRMVGFHVKDLAPEGGNASEDGWADVGYGRLDWTALLPVMRATPAQVWTLEHDNPSDDRRFADRSFATVRGW
jgi:sugar phosphate isomerase/epimerase